MTITDVLKPESILFLKSGTKNGAFSELAEHLSETSGIPQDRILSAIHAREESLSTRIADTVAIPHAILPDILSPSVALGISRKGLLYDARTETRVHLVAMIVGNGQEHLELLRVLAASFQDADTVRSLVSVESPQAAFRLLSKPAQIEAHQLLQEESKRSELVLHHADELARETDISRIVIHAETEEQITLARSVLPPDRIVVVAYRDFGFPAADVRRRNLIILPFRGLGRAGKIEMSLLFLLSQGYLSRTDHVLHILGEASVLDSLIITDVEREFQLFFAFQGEDRPEDLELQVLTRVLQIAYSLALEGREGKPVGTLFILGDYDSVRRYSQQLIINPFRGYPEEERNILDPSLEETVKEFSRIDGAFVIRGDGLIVSAGTYIKTGEVRSGFISGLGARHAAAASVSAVTGAVAIAVSESTRKVSLFRAGQRFLLF